MTYRAPVTWADDMVEIVFGDDEQFGTTYAAVVARGDEILAERYGGALPRFDGDGEPVTAGTPLLSWSVAKSVLHVAVGVLVGDGRLDVHAPAFVPEWSAPDDPRGAITVDHLLAMRDGLAFVEDYVDAGVSDVIEMLFGAGHHDVAHFAADRPAAHPPDTVFNYSSGASNIVARIVGDIAGPIEPFLRARVFDPIGMKSATIRTDEIGTFIGSSYVYATARDWVRFGQCYLHGGAGLVTPEWVAHGTTRRSVDPVDGGHYGSHWWVFPPNSDHPPAFYGSGYEGQRVVVCPGLDLVFVRFGNSTAEQYPALMSWCGEVMAACTVEA
jgi:CubicO group peptidase (beta-lactamase class C family)